MPALNLQLVASSLMLLTPRLLQLSATVEGFQNHCVSRLTPTPNIIRGGTRTFNSINDDDDDDDGESSTSLPLSTPSSTSSQLEKGEFNPFDYQRNNKSSRSSGSAPPRVDLRSLRMSSLTGDLLNGLGDEAAMRTILEENRDFLLEPLEVEDSLAASGSIYTPDMSRLERYRAYRKSVEQRLESSGNEKAKAVLTAMKDYVLEFENESPF